MKLNQGGVADLIVIVKGDITNKTQLEELQIDTIVNAAKPTLMGSDQGVDGAIHQAVDQAEGEGFLNEKTREELQEEEQIVLCRRGQAVTTSGHSLCRNIIHAVGIQYDGDIEHKKECSSSHVHILESCYYSIVEQIKRHPKMCNIAVPIIGSGEYGFPFDLAAEIAIAGIGNALVEWYQQEPETLVLANLEHIYFFIHDKSKEVEKKKLQKAQELLRKHQKILCRNKKVVFQTSWTAHKRYWREVKNYDERRGYFSIARRAREILLIVRAIFFLPMLVKDWYAKNDWKNRRKYVEKLAFAKVALPLVCYIVCMWLPLGNMQIIVEAVSIGIIGYCMLDTITYLLTLILLADIQRPSANIIRSLILLFVNYAEVSLDMAVLYYFYEKIAEGKEILFREAIQLGFFGVEVSSDVTSFLEHIFLYANEGIRFFFITIIFGYFASSMKQRQFKS